MTRPGDAGQPGRGSLGGAHRPAGPLGTRRYLVRAAEEHDLDTIAGFEIEIARVSFGDEAVEDPALHRKRVAGALGRPGEVTLVAVDAAEPATPLGWAWLSGRTNSLTGARYGNFRSLATADVPGRGEVAELLMRAVLDAATAAGHTQVTGKVHAGNLGMRTLYAKFGFRAAHLTMEWREGPGPPGADMTEAALVKCVVWDIDNTLLSGPYLEAGETPPAADPVAVGVLDELARRGILQAIASRNPPGAAEHAARVTGGTFAAVRCGWDDKSAALREIAAELGIATSALAFVDDDPYERAEVAMALPDVTVLSPEEAAEAPGWPGFSPPVVTDEARRRGELYAARRARQEAELAFAGGKPEFLRWAGTEVGIRAAVPGDSDRLDELAARTRQFNSAARPAAPGEFAGLMGAPGVSVLTVRLRDTFADDGLVGGCVVVRSGQVWTVDLIMVSCRAMGRGVIDALLAWLVRTAHVQGAEVAVPCVLTDRNVPLRLALTGAGFRARRDPAPGERVVYRRAAETALPGLPDGVSVPGTLWDDSAAAAALRGMLVAATGRDDLVDLPVSTPLFGDGIGLDSLTATVLLRQVKRRFGVDVAAEDLNLDALATLRALAGFVAERAQR